MRKIPVARLPELYAALDAGRQLWIPLENGGIVDFALWKQGAPVSLAGKTAKSGKDFFFPQTEDIVSFRTHGKEITIAEADRATAPFVVFGMRGCDAAGMGVLDRVFLADPKDTFYEARRNAGTIVSLACGGDLPNESCFCAVFGVAPSAPAGDVTAWIVGDTLYWKPITEKGEKLTADLS
ncbi:MAG: 4Fe-4S ferredoxin, partial [Planctomycetota bacterium]|nr:4Fe-4S ferredoxin [Planctomycetota bacterium]